MNKQVVKVEGMPCPKCEMLVSLALEDLGAQNVVASREAGTVEFEGELPFEAVKAAIEDCGFSAIA